MCWRNGHALTRAIPYLEALREKYRRSSKETEEAAAALSTQTDTAESQAPDGKAGASGKPESAKAEAGRQLWMRGRNHTGRDWELFDFAVWAAARAEAINSL